MSFEGARLLLGDSAGEGDFLFPFRVGDDVGDAASLLVLPLVEGLLGGVGVFDRDTCSFPLGFEDTGDELRLGDFEA